MFRLRVTLVVLLLGASLGAAPQGTPIRFQITFRSRCGEGTMRFSIALAAMLIAGLPPVGVGGTAEPSAATQASLAPGDAAPSFTLKGKNERTYPRADFRGKQAVVLAWFAKPFSGG